MITTYVKMFSELWGDELQTLLQMHWNEVDHRRKTTEMNIVKDFYDKIEATGMHYIIAAYDQEKLIGYMSMFIAPSPHTGTLHATTDVMFVHPEYRNKNIGKELIKSSEQEAKRRNAEHIMVTFKNNVDHSKLVDGLDYYNYETIYSKYIGKKQ